MIPAWYVIIRKTYKQSSTYWLTSTVLKKFFFVFPAHSKCNGMVVSSYMSHAETTKYRSVVFARFTPFNLLDPPSPPFAPIKLNCTPNLVQLVKIIKRSALHFCSNYYWIGNAQVVQIEIFNSNHICIITI